MPLSRKTTRTPSAKTILSAAASAAATAVLIRSITRDLIPRELRNYVFGEIKNLIASFSSESTLVIEEYDGLNHNHIFKAADLYLEPMVNSKTQTKFRVIMPKEESKITLSMGRNEEVVDSFNGVQLKWKFLSKSVQSKVVPPNPDRHNSTVFKYEIRFFELSFHKKHKDMVLDSYLPHVVKKSKEMSEKNKKLKLFTLRYDGMMEKRMDAWQSVNLEHPATFDTMAMDIEVKKMIMDDLERFVRRREYYRRVGKAWKRGYLLFGPPGTGKSSLVAAMANYLNFDIYDLELTDLRSNSELRRLLISTGNRSILVVEDIDCSIELQNRIAEARAANPRRFYQESQVTLSGLLNFTDGLWSSCGDERIIVFTTNHKDKLDPALMRPGRMDLHVHLSYCTPCGFRKLASNYLFIAEHSLFSKVDELIGTIKVTPAEIGEQLMKDEVPEIALTGLIEFLEGKIRQRDEAKAASDQAELEAENKMKAEKAEGTQKLEEQKSEKKEGKEPHKLEKK